MKMSWFYVWIFFTFSAKMWFFRIPVQSSSVNRRSWKIASLCVFVFLLFFYFTCFHSALLRVPAQRLYLSLPLSMALIWDAVSTQNSSIRGTRGNGNAHIHTNTEEGSVCCGWWWRPNHKSQEVAGRNVLQCHTWPRPEYVRLRGLGWDGVSGAGMRGFKLQTASVYLEKDRDTTVKIHVTLSSLTRHTCLRHLS